MILKRLFSICAAAALAATLMCAGANELYELYKQRPRPYFGARLSASYAHPSNVKYARVPLSSAATGFDVALSGLFHAPFTYKPFYVEPQVEVYFNSLKTSGQLSERVTEAGITKATLKTIGFRVPIYFGWEKPLSESTRFSVFVGPEFDFRLKTDFNPDKETIIFKGTTKDPLYGDYGVDLDIRGGLGYSFGSYYIGATYAWKICKITRSDYGAKRQRMISVTFGYNFKPL